MAKDFGNVSKQRTSADTADQACEIVIVSHNYVQHLSFLWRISAGGQRFLFPGSSKAGKQDGGSSHALEQWPCPPSGSASRVTPTFEAGLEEVWSVRKNIGTGVGTTQGGRRVGVGGGMVGGQLNCGKTSQQGVFSRHNPMSMAAQPAASHGRSIGAARSTSECGRGGRAHSCNT